MIAQPTTTINYSYVQSFKQMESITILTKFSNSETLETYFKNISNIIVNSYDKENDNDDEYKLDPKKKTINVVMKITKISKKIPKIDIEDFERLED